MDGFLISYNRGKESMAIKEIKSILNSINYNTDQQESNNIQKLLNRKIETMKNSQFICLNKPKLKTLSIIKNTSQVPSLDLFQSIKKDKIKTKYIQRIIPLSFITLNSDIQTHIKSYCDAVNRNSGTYKILYKSRCSKKEIKEKIFEIITFYVTNSVDLDKPDNFIVVEVMCNILGIGTFKTCDFNINVLHNDTN